MINVIRTHDLTNNMWTSVPKVDKISMGTRIGPMATTAALVVYAVAEVDGEVDGAENSSMVEVWGVSVIVDK